MISVSPGKHIDVSTDICWNPCINLLSFRPVTPSSEVYVSVYILSEGSKTSGTQTNKMLKYACVGGRLSIAPVPLSLQIPLQIACVQPVASYKRGGSHVAAILLRSDRSNAISDVTRACTVDSTETEWASILFGIKLALKHDEDTIGIEHTNMGIINALIYRKTVLKIEYAEHYRNEIQRLLRETEWTGIRWIPREANHATDLLK